MQRHRIASLTIVSATLLIAGIALAAQDRWLLKTPNGISFSEFKGYESWDMIASSTPDNEGGCGTSKAPGCIKSILGNATLIQAYRDGIPANGKPVPDGAAFAKIEWAKARLQAPYPASVPGALAEISFMMKDSKRFAKTNGWGYATFTYDTASDTWAVGHSENAEFATTCHGCHTLVKARDFVFTNFPKR
jgi:hypothetical protein